MDSIIFDLDGTLWDSSDTVLIALNTAIKQNNPEQKQITKQELQRAMGLQSKQLGEKLFPQVNEKMQKQLLTDWFHLECQLLSKQGGRLYPHVEKVLEALSQTYKLYIVSNCQSGYIEAFYEYHQLDTYFLDYEHPGRTGLTKGENIQLIVDRNQLTNPVYVGDTNGDQQAATDANMPFVYARYGFGNVDGYDYVIDHFNELLNIF